MLPTPESLIPHRKPMLLLDKIIDMGDTLIVAETKILPDAFFLRGHYPDFPIVPGIITCEGLFQAGAALLAHRARNDIGQKSKLPVVTRIQSAKFRKPIFPGDLVTFYVAIQNEISNACYFTGEARVNNTIHASANFACTTGSSL